MSNNDYCVYLYFLTVDNKWKIVDFLVYKRGTGIKQFNSGFNGYYIINLWGYSFILSHYLPPLCLGGLVVRTLTSHLCGGWSSWFESWSLYAVKLVAYLLKVGGLQCGILTNTSALVSSIIELPVLI